MTDSPLFAPARMGPWDLTSRIAMAPMTRHRAGPDWTPAPYATDYYGQRASAGMVITEATQCSAGAARGTRARRGCGTTATPRHGHGSWSASTPAVPRRWALLHKSADARTSPSPGQTYPVTFVTGMPSAVKPFRTATRTWNSAT